MERPGQDRAEATAADEGAATSGADAQTEASPVPPEPRAKATPAEQPSTAGHAEPADEGGHAAESEEANGSPEGNASSEDDIDWKDRYIRLAADFDNTRKRQRNEIKEARQFERERVLREFLDVADSAQRALDSAAASSSDDDPWIQGLRAIVRQLHSTLKRFDVVEIDTENQIFDPNLHEAIAVVPTPDAKHNAILQTERPGYRFESGRVLRPARVVVAREKSPG